MAASYRYTFSVCSPGAFSTIEKVINQNIGVTIFSGAPNEGDDVHGGAPVRVAGYVSELVGVRFAVQRMEKSMLELMHWFQLKCFFSLPL